MIAFPLYSILFFYIFFLAFFCIFAAIDFYHILISASFTIATFTVTLFTVVIAALSVYGTMYLLQGTDWHQSITVFNAVWFSYQ
ncbi:MAG: hypothetical protein HYY51_02760 [Candidatus Magasanikbacteria bacterium]|nr:hypothetical protein [Candidatus Magasanikbacteria bacterium]